MANSGDDVSDSSIVVGLSDSLIMPREQVKASSLMPPSAARITWDEMCWDEFDTYREPAPEKVSKIKKLLRCVGVSKKDE